MTIDELLAEARRRLRRLEPQFAADAMRNGSVLIAPDPATGEARHGAH